MNEEKQMIVPFRVVFVLLMSLMVSGAGADLISFYDFEEPSPFEDKISGVVGAIGANVTIESGTPLGNAALFPDGSRVDNDILVAQSDAPVIGLSDFTCMAWVRRATVTTDADGICDMVTGTTEGGFQMLLVADFRLGVGGPGNQWMLTQSVTPVPQDMEWHHYAASVERNNPTGLRMYIDGVLDSATDPTGYASVFMTANQDYQIGSMNNNSLNGWLDELAIFDTALTEVEILAAMTGVKSGFPLAARPDPEDGAIIEATWANLSWRAGKWAVAHDLYFGTSFDDVNEGAEGTFAGNLATTTQVVGFPGFPAAEGLQPGTTYYWRVDEVNDANAASPWKGNVWSFSVPPRTAYLPVPADGGEAVALVPELAWSPGFEAKLHTVYFGDNFDDVNNATGGPLVDNTTFTPPGLLELAKTYYWRVDEFDPPNTYKGAVWSFRTEGTAADPSPAKGAVDISPTPILEWTAADLAGSHEIYFGDDADAVANADKNSPEYKASQSVGQETFDADRLELMTTYYWRVDEVNSTEAGSPWKGNIWSFTTGDFLVVDDFESYNDIDPPDEASNRIFDKWIDGYGTLDNGALIGNPMPPYAEQTIVHGGSQSMNYAYDNAGKTSEATLTLASQRDWTAEGVTKLRIWVRGSAANAADRVYVALNGTAVVYHKDTAATQLTGWNEWVIDLSEFGVNLANVDSITIGVGTKNAPLATGGTGTMYFDDIRLIR